MHRISSSFDFEQQNWHTVYPRGASRRSGLIFYARVDGSFSVWDPLRPAAHLQFPLGARSSGPVPGFHFAPSQIWNGLTADDHDGSVLCNGLIRDWTTWQLRRDSTFDLLTRVLEVLSPRPGETLRPGAITTRVSLHDVRDIPTLDMPYGNVPVVLASAGMKRILSFAYAVARQGSASRAYAVIHVHLQPEPARFDALVRQPGLRALTANLEPLPPTWRECLDDLRDSYRSICAYLCVLVPRGTGARSVDHVAPKSKRRELAYEWSNYRFVCSLMNARKRDFDDVLDPMEIPDGWFVLEMSFLQVLATSAALTARADPRSSGRRSSNRSR
ncbi:hypothetical protein WMF27_17135 [Sorangium sp. So ce281]|uniref:hypothetical protein n=1 Tax=unclassified Sorangium TaxID=2621164 RepID=UPI003F62C18C